MEERDFHSPEYRQWRSRVFRRDKFQCRMPGCQRKGSLNAHHIKRWADAPSLRFVVGNGITLCRECHKQICGQEIEYESLFLQLLNQTKNKSNQILLQMMLLRFESKDNNGRDGQEKTV